MDRLLTCIASSVTQAFLPVKWMMGWMLTYWDRQECLFHYPGESFVLLEVSWFSCSVQIYQTQSPLCHLALS